MIVIVIADEIFHGIVRKQLLEFVVELSRQRFVGGQNECRLIESGDNLGHGKGFSGARNPQKDVIASAFQQIDGKFINSPGLVAGRLKFGN